MLSSSIKTVSSISPTNRLNELFTELSCLNALHDETQPLKRSHRVHASMNVWRCGILLLLLLLMFCLFHGILSMKALCFLSLLVHSLWSICLGSEWIFQAEITRSTIYTQSVLGWASLSFKIFFFSVCEAF